MTVTAKVISDSISPEGIRLTTLHLRYPRMIHSEFMTHRVFSRNGRSSRAVPVLTLLEEAPYIPYFMKNKGGMVATEELPEEDLAEAVNVWNQMVYACKEGVRKLNELKVHKQWANRPLEWFGYIDVLVSSTDWANWDELRDEVGAQPEIDQLAKAIKEARANSTPYELNPGDWHMPYIEDKDIAEVTGYLLETKSELGVLETLKRVSVARCARLTIKPFDGDGSIEKELKRYDLLMVSRPVHASPAEHVSQPDRRILTDGVAERWEHPEEHGNFYGWRQFRKMIPFNTIYDR